METHAQLRRTLSGIDGQVILEEVLDRASQSLRSKVEAVTATFALVQQPVVMSEVVEACVVSTAQHTQICDTQIDCHSQEMGHCMESVRVCLERPEESGGRDRNR